MAKCWVGFDGYGITGVDEEFVHFIFDVVVNMTKMKEDAEIGLVLCDDDYIQNLNKKYRKQDYIPNVLSFVYGEIGKEEFLGDDKNYLGDIFISKSKIEDGAKDLETTERQEFTRLFVHGLLHLQGMKHDTDASTDKMEVLEDRILSQINSTE